MNNRKNNRKNLFNLQIDNQKQIKYLDNTLS